MKFPTLTRISKKKGAIGDMYVEKTTTFNKDFVIAMEAVEPEDRAKIGGAQTAITFAGNAGTQFFKEAPAEILPLIQILHESCCKQK